MNARICLLPVAAAIAFIVALSAPVQAETAHGTWNLTPQGSKLELEIRWHSDDGTSNEESSTDVDPQSLGVTSALASSGQHAAFTLRREAGDFAFDGWLGHGEGAGSYTFTSNESFFDALRKRGYDVTLGRKMGFAEADVTLAYVDAMEAQLRTAGINERNARRMLEMKALGITPQYVSDIQRAGVSELDERRIVELRSMNITAAYIADIANNGYPHLSARELVEFKSMGIDGAYLRKLAQHGFKNLPARKVIEFKSMGIV